MCWYKNILDYYKWRFPWKPSVCSLLSYLTRYVPILHLSPGSEPGFSYYLNAVIQKVLKFIHIKRIQHFIIQYHEVYNGTFLPLSLLLVHCKSAEPLGKKRFPYRTMEPLEAQLRPALLLHSKWDIWQSLEPQYRGLTMRIRFKSRPLIRYLDAPYTSDKAKNIMSLIKAPFMRDSILSE